jgi:drug/metabolite transporter (DMT)-like permease
MMNKALKLRLMFAFVCIVWGSTWIAMKEGATHVPPAMFSGLRWTTAGLLQLFYIWWSTGKLRLPSRRALKRLLVVALLVNTLNQLFMMYSLQRVGSGIGAVINAGLTPLSLLVFAVAIGYERLTLRGIIAMAIGVAGVVVLFGPSAVSGTLDGSTMFGAALVVLGTLTYSGGSVLARPVTAALTPTQVAGTLNLIGGVTLVVISLLFEPGATAALSLNWGWGPWAAWLFLLLPASLGASTIFLILVRDWGPSKAGSFAFISPILAVFEGVWLRGESISFIEAVGMTLMLVGAWFALRRT